MGITAAELDVKVHGDDRDLTRGLHHAEGEVQKSTGGIGRHFTALGGHMLAAGAAIGGAILAPMALVAKQGYDKLTALQQVNAQTANVIRSTGGAAHVTTGQIANMSSTLEKHSMIEQEAIQNGANLMLTFTGVKNAAGAGNDIFNQSVTAAANLSTALGQDMQSSVIQLGKALNDPIRGVTALRRVGVSFTADQQKQIKAMVASGHTMQAQKLILGELKTEFGGAAQAASQTFAGAMFQAKQAVQDAGAEMVKSLLPVGTKVLPELATAVSGLVTSLGPAFAQVIGALGGLLAGLLPVVAPIAKVFGDVAGSLATVLVPILTRLAPIFGNLAGQTGIILNALMPLIGVVGDLATAGFQVLAGFAGLVARALQVLAPVINSLAKTFDDVFQAIMPVIETAFDALRPVIGQIAGAFGKLIQAILPLIPRLISGLLPAFVMLIGLFVKLLPSIIPILTLLTQLASAVLPPLITVISALAGFLAGPLGSALTFIVGQVGDLIKWVTQSKIGLAILAAVITALFAPALILMTGLFISSTVAAIAAAAPIIGIVAAVMAVVIGVKMLVEHWRGAWTGIKAAIGAAWNFIKSHVNLILAIFAPIVLGIAFVARHWRTIWNGMLGVLGVVVAVSADMARHILDVFLGMVSTILGAMSHLPFIGHYFASAKKAVDKFHSDIDNTLSGIANNARSWGKATAVNFAQGISLGTGAIDRAADKAAGAAASKMMGQSPTKEGPLSLRGGTEQWGYNHVKNFAVGMLKAAAAVDVAAAALAPQMTTAARFSRPFVPGAPGGLSGAIVGSGGGVGGQTVIHQTHVEVTVQGGMFSTEERVIDAVHSGLREKRRRVGDLGLGPS